MKTITSLCLALAAVSGTAWAADPATYWNERQESASRYREPIDIAIFPGTVSTADPHIIVGRYLPVTNYLTKATGSLVSVVPEPRYGAFREKLAAGYYDIVYVTADLAVTALKNGYEPVVQRNLPIDGAVLVPAASPAKSIDELAGKTLAVITGSLLDGMARHYSAERGNKIKVVGLKVANQPDLALSLENGSADAAVMRGEFAAKLASSGKYRVLGTMGSAPGFLLMAKPAAREPAKRLATALLAIDKAAGVTDILRGMDGVGSPGGTAFRPATAADLDATTRMLETAQSATGTRLIIDGKGAAK